MHRADRGILLTMAGSLLLALAVLGVITVLESGAGATAAVDEPGEADVGAAEPGGVDPELLAELRDGGEVLLFRHALTDRSGSDFDPVARGGCDQQRNLSLEGRRQAARIGQAMRQAGLPIGPVHASPFCRTIETAIALDADAVASEAMLSLTAAPSTEEAARITELARQLVVDALGTGDLVLGVTHTQNIEALTGVLVEEGDAVVLGADGDGAFEVLATIRADDW